MALKNMAPNPPLNLDPLNLEGKAKAAVTQVTTSPTQSLDNLFQEIYDKVKADGDKIIADMQKAQAIAATKLPDGTPADQPSNLCLTALIPVIQLIVDNQLAVTQGTASVAPAVAGVPSTPDGVVTAFVKVRVVINALQGASVQSNCSWLQQTIQTAGTSGLAGILAGLLGITKLAPMAAIL